MTESLHDAEERVRQYAALEKLELRAKIGFGNDGIVFSTNKNTVVKGIMRQDTYLRERDAYRRLFEDNITKLAGFSIPLLVNYHNALQIVEVELMMPPFIIDFGKAYLDRPPDFTPEAMEDWEQERRELYTEEQWPRVLGALAALQAHGIYYFDPQPGNIKFAKDEDLRDVRSPV